MEQAAWMLQMHQSRAGRLVEGLVARTWTTLESCGQGRLRAGRQGGWDGEDGGWLSLVHSTFIPQTLGQASQSLNKIAAIGTGRKVLERNGQAFAAVEGGGLAVHTTRASSLYRVAWSIVGDCMVACLCWVLPDRYRFAGVHSGPLQREVPSGGSIAGSPGLRHQAPTSPTLSGPSCCAALSASPALLLGCFAPPFRHWDTLGGQKACLAITSMTLMLATNEFHLHV
ncbi:hypothetical protein V8C86DRAFT_1341369 [Haematococcus lacustris]